MNITSAPGRTVGRYFRALALGDNSPDRAMAFASGQHWTDIDDIRKEFDAFVTKASVPAASLADLPITPVGRDFWAARRPLSILGRLPLARVYPLRTRIASFTSGLTAHAVAEGSAAPIGAAAFSTFTLFPQKIVAIAAVTSELLERSLPGSEAAISADLAAAVSLTEDQLFVLPASAGSITAGVTPIASTGSTVAQVDADLRAAVQQLIAANARVASSVWLMGESTALSLSLLRTTSGEPAYEDITAAGGQLLGLPVVTSQALTGAIVLVDQAGLAWGHGGDRFEASTQASLEMTTAPTGSTTAATAGQSVSMFGTNSVALRATVFSAWYARPGAVSLINGVSY